MQNTARSKRQLGRQKMLPKFLKIQTEDSGLSVPLDFLRENRAPVLLQKKSPNHNSLLLNDYEKAKNCLSRIADPLWLAICADLLTMMGPVSVLKIWESKLGEFSSQDRSLYIVCETEETQEFIQKYDFVILGSLKRYFPALKSLTVNVIST